MSRLILLRHGQASFGADRYDALSDLGRQQAEYVGQYFSERGLRFDRVCIGPRDRHRFTARYALAAVGLDASELADAALDEFAEGQQILASVEMRVKQKLHGKDAARQYVQEIEAWAEGRSVIPGVRSVQAFRATVAAWLTDVTADASPGQTVLVVTSGGVIGAALAQVLNLPDASLAGFMGVIYNASLTELAFSAGRSSTLVSFNVASYLPDALLTRI